ncbi:hypothetical protein FA13DRAFT_1867560, partial [Coprinellus micaceus]
ITEHLEPLAIASNIFQAPTCRLDHVLLTLGSIFSFFQNLPDEPGNEAVKDAMEKSIERQWGKTHQELFILATFFNPYIRSRFFNADYLSLMVLFHITKRAVRKLTGQSLANEPAFFVAFRDYYNSTGMFSPASMWLTGFQNMFSQPDQETNTVNILQVWETFRSQNPGWGHGAFIALVVWLHSMVPNSASTESLFSMFGTTHTKRRNRLSPQKVHNSSVVWLDSNHIFRGDKTRRKERMFDAQEGVGGSNQQRGVPR